MKNRLLGLAWLPLILLVTLAGCSGESGSSAPAAKTLSGTAAVGFPIVNGAINISFATGSALTATTDDKGYWQVTLSGQTLPCAVQVSGGTINGAANTASYHSIATALGTVNVTPLTDLIVANLAGTATPGTWFDGLSATPTPLTTITQAKVDAALANLRAALSGLTPLSAINPITTAFTAKPGNVSDDMLAALKMAMTNANVTYTALMGNASAVTFTAPAGFGTALTAAYAGTTSGSTSGGGSSAGNYTLTISGTASGVAIPAITINNIPKPTDQTAFCGDASVQSALNSAASGGTLTINSCTFNGTTGSISATLNITTPVAMTVPYTVNYSYAANGGGGSGGAGAPTVTSFSPATGAAGSTVTIIGTNLGSFIPAPLVKFGTTTATVSSATSTSVVVTVPSGLASGNSTITLSNLDGTGAVTVGTFNVTAAGGGGTGTTSGSTTAPLASLANGSYYRLVYSAGMNVGIDQRSATAHFSSSGAMNDYTAILFNGSPSTQEAPSLGTASVAELAGDDKVTIGRWNGGTTAGNFYNMSAFAIAANQGFHYAIGVPPASLPADGTSKCYTLTSATHPTIGDGSVAPGGVTPGAQVKIVFGATGKLAIDMAFAVGSNTVAIQTPGGMASPVTFGSNGASYFASSPAPFGYTITDSANNTISAYMFLAGANSERLGMSYTRYKGAGGNSASLQGAAYFSETACQ